jgi:2-hydroxy-3-keto-5-methylthiopentenyl-1-phosphate phosphatase
LINVFDLPSKYLGMIQNTVFIPKEKQNRHQGKSMVVVFLTRFCKVGCTHCIEDEVSSDGCSKIVDFINSADVEYVLIAGGGEPFEQEELVYRVVNRSKVNRIVIVTNGFWGRTIEKASYVIQQLQKIVSNKKEQSTLVLRLSLDQWHTARIGNQVIVNIVNAFDNLIGENEHFKLELHTIENDKSIDEIQVHLPNSHLNMGAEQVVSDTGKVMKNSKRRGILTLESGLNIPVGYAKLFYPNLLVNLNRPEEVQRAMKPFYDDVNINQKGNYSVIYNDDGTKGLDYLINFNGNITTWGNYQLETISNIYIDSYQDILDNLYNDIISYSMIDKRLDFRENLIKPVNPLAVTRASAINIRDYSGAYMLQEHHTALFYAIRAIRHYRTNGVIDISIFKHLPNELIYAINAEEQTLIEMYKQSNYSIIQQYMNDPKFTAVDWIDLFKLIQLNHYIVRDDQLKEGLEFLNKKYGFRFSDVDEVVRNMDVEGVIARLIERMTFQQPAVAGLSME